MVPALNELLHAVEDQRLEGGALRPGAFHEDLFTAGGNGGKLVRLVEGVARVVDAAHLSLARGGALAGVLPGHLERGQVGRGARALAVAVCHPRLVPNHCILVKLREELDLLVE